MGEDLELEALKTIIKEDPSCLVGKGDAAEHEGWRFEVECDVEDRGRRWSKFVETYVRGLVSGRYWKLSHDVALTEIQESEWNFVPPKEVTRHEEQVTVTKVTWKPVTA